MANLFTWIFKIALPKTQTLAFENVFKNVEKETQGEFVYFLNNDIKILFVSYLHNVKKYEIF